MSDVAANRFVFGYNLKGELSTVLYPGGVRQTRTYDVFGRDSTDRIVRSGSTAFPYFGDTLLRDFKVTTRNARGQILIASDASSLSGGVPSATYDSVGHVIRSKLVQNGYSNTAGALSSYVSGDTLTYDGLGNILSTRNGWSLGTTTSSEASQHTYDVTTGRLATRARQTAGSSSLTQFTHDAAGNTRFESTAGSDDAISVERASYYGADDRLVATDLRTPGKQLVEEYRYDALGRRVWVSTRWRCAPSADVACIANAVTRTLWDGASEVAEIRAQYDTSAAATEEMDAGADTVPKSIVGDANPFYGRVVYGPALALDQPLSVARFEYRDNPYAQTSQAWPTFTLVPFWDYRGTPAFGLFADGAFARPYAAGGSSCPASPGTGTTDRCVLLTWPFAGSAYHQDRGLALTYSWQGSLLLKKRDVSGLMYARNRMYDPATGRFTQEDPIGLAGGLNAYGFASGDPVNYGDPFGLCPDKTDANCSMGAEIYARVKSIANSVIDAVGSAGAALMSSLPSIGKRVAVEGLVFAASAGAGAALEGTVTLYRAVSLAEAADIVAMKGALRVVSSSAEGKYFATSASDAATFGRLLEPNGFRVISAEFPASVAQALYAGRMDGIAARFATIEQLQHAVVAFIR